MPTLELTHLTLHPTIPPTSPLILTTLTHVRTLLATQIHPTHSRFFSPPSNPSEIYIFGSWPSLAAHQAFLASLMREEILGDQEDVFVFRWGVHVEMEEGVGMEGLPLDGKVVVVERVVVGDGMDEVGRWREVDRPGKVFWGWRCDVGKGEREMVVTSGWESEGAYEEFRNNASDEYAGIKRMNVMVLRDLEA